MVGLAHKLCIPVEQKQFKARLTSRVSMVCKVVCYSFFPFTHWSLVSCMISVFCDTDSFYFAENFCHNRCLLAHAGFCNDRELILLSSPSYTSLLPSTFPQPPDPVVRHFCTRRFAMVDLGLNQ